ncbi:MAG: methyltransferase domain-containing protein [Nanoarchaeota archaeon]
MDLELEKSIKSENRKLHNFSAKNYDNYPPYLLKKENKGYHQDLSFIKKRFINNQSPKSLDCGCGTGKLALNLLRKGFLVSVLDISEEMIKITNKKIKKSPFRDNNVISYVSEIDDFFIKNDEKFELICFTSVLHHLGDYFKTLDYAIKHLNNNGVIYISGEPQLITTKNRLIKIIEFMSGQSINIYRTLKNPKHTINFLRNKFSKNQNNKAINVDLAEFHASKGLEDKKIVEFLQKSGFKVLKFETFLIHPFSFFEIFNFFYKNRPKTFKLIAQKI